VSWKILYLDKNKEDAGKLGGTFMKSIRVFLFLLLFGCKGFESATPIIDIIEEPTDPVIITEPKTAPDVTISVTQSNPFFSISPASTNAAANSIGLRGRLGIMDLSTEMRSMNTGLRLRFGFIKR
jgi:hypothetical protein